MANINSDRSLKVLSDEQQVRQRPAVIFGTNNEAGAFHGIFEVIDNCIDEAREGHGKEIDVTVENDNIITVVDCGRGLYMDWNEELQCYNWELALCRLYASGKYDSEQYSQALGLNGLGLTAMQYASSYMKVWATYDGQTRYMEFKEGVPVEEMKILPPIKDGTGTKIEFQPDPIVFPALRHKPLTATMFILELRRQAMLLAGLKITLKHYELNNAVVLMYEGGAEQYLDSLSDKRMLPQAVEFTDSAIGTDDPEVMPETYQVDMKVTFNFSRDLGDGLSGFVEIYHNSSLMSEGGLSVKAFEFGITQAFTDVAKQTGKIGKNEKFVYKDIEDILLCVATTDAPGNRTWFKNQVKTAINNPFIEKAFRQFIYNKFRYWLDQNQQLASKVITEVVTNKTAREEGAEVSKKVINKLSKAVGFGSKPKGFINCSSKNVAENEVYFVEGRSALTSVKLACNPKFQAMLALRGKPINCLKEKLTRVLKNDIVIDIYRVLGCGIEAKSEYINDLPKFDLSKLRWGKVIICTDADVDGMHIRCLMLVMFYVLSPSLLKAGKVYIAETPLYEITYKKETRFAYNDSEKDTIINDFEALGAKPNQIKIQRSKGLGENTPEMMAISTMNPMTRRLIPVEYPEDEATLRDMLNALLGDDIETRRILIDEYFDLVNDTVDI